MSTARGGERFLADDLCEAKVGDLDVELFVDDQDVFWLDVSVYDVAFML
jgi:hypothetical protein